MGAVPFSGVALTSAMPSFNGRPSVRVVHREAVASIRNTITSNFAMLPQVGQSPGWDIAPGNPVLFPWLSNIAVNYEQYHFHRLVFHLISGQAANQAGRVYMAVDYDWDDEVATTFAEMMNSQSATEGMAWHHLQLRCDPKAMHEDKYFKFTKDNVREAPEPRTTYSGFLMIATNVPAVYSWDLMVEYDVEFRTPQGSGVPRYIQGSTVTGPMMIGTNNSGQTVVVPPVPDQLGLARVAVPNSTVHAGLALGGAHALDLNAIKEGIIGTSVQLSQANLSPASAFATTLPNCLNFLCYDAGWTLVGDTVAAGVTSQLAPYNPSSVATPGQPMIATSDLSSLFVRSVYSAARYLVPLINFGVLPALNAPVGSTTMKTEV